MYNSYVSSFLSVRRNGSLSFSFNDQCCFLNDRFDRNLVPLSSRSCCACCANSVYRVPISPSYWSGLRQSSLIQWSATRRLVLGGGDPFYCRSSVRDVGRNCCCGHVCPLKERSVTGRRGRWGEGRFRRMIWDERAKSYHSSDFDDVEVILSLLTEEVSEECLGVRERDCNSSRSVEVEKRNVGCGGASGRKKKALVGSGLLKRNLKSEFESVRIESREECYGQKENRRREDKESYSSSERHRGRKSGSSCSSYYSCNSLGEFESDTEVHQEGHGEESAGGVKRDSERSGVVMHDGEIKEDVKWHRDGVGMHGEKTAVGSYAASSGVECNWRKKSEKKLTEVSSEQTESKEKSSQKHRRLLEVEEIGYGQASSSYQQSDDVEEKSTSAMSIDDGTRQQYSKKADGLTGKSESRVKYKHITGVQEIHGGDIEAISSSEKCFSGRGENSSEAEHFILETEHEDSKTADYGSHTDGYRRNLQQLDEALEIQEINVSRTSTSQRQSEVRVKKLEDKSNVILGSVWDKEERRHIAGQWESRERDSRGKFQQLTEISDDNTSTSLRQSDSRMKTQEDNSTFIFGPAEAKGQHSQTAQQAVKKMESRKGSQDVSNISVVHSSDAQVTNKQRTSEKRISSQETYSASVVKSTEETVERHNRTEGRVFQVGSKKATQKPSKSLGEGTLKEASGTQTSLILKTQPTLEHTGVDVGDQSSSQAIVTPPPSQLIARGPLHVEPTNVITIPEISTASFESGYDTRTGLNTQALRTETYEVARGGETHDQPLNFISQEDALGSVDRLQKSSMHFVGEFIEKVTHEVSTSQVQKEGRTSEKESVNEGRKHQQKSLSGDFKSKEHDSRQSSRSPGVKGPSDEIWDVTEPSTQETARIDAPERTTATANIIAKRTGRSLWNIISDIVLLRWARSESHSSTIKSGGRSSANQSASSEAWLSGQEPDKNTDDNVRREKKIMSQGATSADQEHLLHVHIGNQGEGSNSASSEDERVHVGVEELSFSSRLESGSASKGNSSVSTEENFGGRRTAMAEPSVSMPSLRIRRSPSLDKISEAGMTNVSVSGSLVQEQPIGTHLTDVSGTEAKDGGLKQRKLQRNNQVPKDRFDEWEEAYKLESEQRKIDEIFMREALLEAEKAADMWEVPVGAVLVQHGKIIARGCNLVEESRDSTAHAEMICIREASNQLRTWRLAETTLYVTLEPCPMCAGAILQARVDTVVWGAPNKLLGADGSWIRLFPNGGEGGNGSELTDKPSAPVHPFHPKIAVRRGVLRAECADVMQQFFQLRRKEAKKPDSPTPPSRLPISTGPSKFLTKMHDAFHFVFCL